MAVISNNSSARPMTLNSVYYSAPITPEKINDVSVSSTPQNIPPPINGDIPVIANEIPTQVIGLVPLFKCCNIATGVIGGFVFANGIADCGSISLRITINGVNYGPVPISNATSDAAATALINGILPIGYTCTVVSSSTLNRVVTITGPAGAIGYTLAAANLTPIPCSGSILSSYNFQNKAENTSCDEECDCRIYPADIIADDKNFALPVFADDACSDSYHNDYNTFLLQYRLGYDAIGNGDFELQMYTDGIGWQAVCFLNTTQYGTPYSNNFFTGHPSNQCTNLNYQGYKIDWRLVYIAFGAGLFRFCVRPTSEKYCYTSPPFCLRLFDCQEVNGTVKFETEYSGGTFGSVTKQGDLFKLCCTNYNSLTKEFTNAIEWTDSIRFAGFFGREGYEHQRDFIKYATGEIDNIRNELIKSFDLRTDKLPLWLHQRFAAYGLMADRLFVSDYNDNNANYHYKRFWVVGDSGYTMDHKNYSRYPKVTPVKFKEGRQLIFRDRCC